MTSVTGFRAGVILFAPIVLVALLAALMVLSLTIGRYPLSPAEVVNTLTRMAPLGAVGRFEDAPFVVVAIVRRPRVLLVTLCGIGLGLSGAAMQGVFRNPLVAPDIVGVSPGASFGGVLAILFGWSAAGTVALAFGFGL